MWFKQAQLFQLSDSIQYTSDYFTKKMEKLLFQECLPSLPQATGWVPPIDDQDAPLVQSINGYMMICMQIEEKILPSIVIRQELDKKVKQIEKLENKKVSAKEKYALKDDITSMLLLRAFSKLTKIYAYIDTRNHWMVLSIANAKKTEQFLSIFKKTFGDNVHPLEIKKLSTMMTDWLKLKNHSPSFSIEKSCVLQDTNHESRVIRCKEQDLFANSIQSLIKDGCEIKQLALNWQDRIDFVLLDNFSLQSIRFKDEIIAQVKELEAGTKQQQFNADFLIMTESLNGLMKDLFDCFALNSTMDAKRTDHNVISMAKIA